MRPHSAGRPTSTARAPSASATSDVGAAADAAVDEHLGAAVDGVDDLGQHLGGRRDAVQLAAAVVRDDHAGGAALAAERRVLAVWTPFTSTGSGQSSISALEIAPGDAGVDQREEVLDRDARAAPDRGG